MSEKNKHGLKRYIPAGVRREVRSNSKFGCVLCRSGFFQYEHIDPTFEEAKQHRADAICCLCGACHDAVTRGQISKKAVEVAYKRIKEANNNDVEPPVGPLDFHDGNAELKISGLVYSPAVHVVLKYHGVDVIKVTPGADGEPGRVSAFFTNEEGEVTLELRDNEWIGNHENWDIEVIGPRLTVRSSLGKIVLQLRLDPPGRIVIERLDMRICDAHVIVTEHAYAVGRYINDYDAFWLHADIKITRSTSTGAAIEFTDPHLLEKRDHDFKNHGTELANHNRSFVMNSYGGVFIKPVGVVISSLCGQFELGQTAYGIRSVNDVRQVILSSPNELCQFLCNGKSGQETR